MLEDPEVVAQLHREFVHAGSDVVEAFTYYGHRAKLRLIGKEDLLEALNRQALAIAKDVAHETGALFAGDISNTNVFLPDDEARREVRAMFDEQVAWAVDADVDYVIGETFSWAEEALLALESIKATGLPAVITLAIHQDPVTRDGMSPEEACKRLEDAGAAVVGLNCSRGPQAAGRSPSSSRVAWAILDPPTTIRSPPMHRCSTVTRSQRISTLLPWVGCWPVGRGRRCSMRCSTVERGRSESLPALLGSRPQLPANT